MRDFTVKGLKKVLKEKTFPILRELKLRGDTKLGASAGKALAQWPRLAELEILDVTDLLNKKGREALCASDYLQGVILEGIPEYHGVTNWRSIKDSEEKIHATMKIVAKKQEIVAEAKKQIVIWAAKFKIHLDFVEQEREDCLCVAMAEIGKNIFNKAKKDTCGEPDIADRYYAVSLVEEAKRKIADRFQEQISKIFFQDTVV